MKKIITSILLFALCPLYLGAFSITDPLYMPEKKQLLADISLSFTNNDFQLDKSYGVNGYLQAGITDNLALGLYLGWAKIRHVSDGMQDPSITFQYRFYNGLEDSFFLDIDGYVSPEVFHSPWNGKGGAAKGATDIGAFLTIGSTESLNNFTIFAKTGLEHFGHTDMVSAGTAWSLMGGAKYYMSEKSSFELDLLMKTYLGFSDDFFGYGFDLNYAYEVTEGKTALVPYFGAEKHNKDIVSFTHWGLKVRYLF